MRIPLTGALSLILSLHTSNPAVAPERPSSNVARPVYLTMKSLGDRDRPLLVFAPSAGSSELVNQRRLLAAGLKELRERQVVVVLVTGGEAPESVSDTELRYLRPDELVAVRRRFHVGEGEFAVVLIGKDGGEKFRTHAPVTIETLAAMIDAMPMRRQEVRDGHAK